MAQQQQPDQQQQQRQTVSTDCDGGKVKLEVEIKMDMFPEETSLTLKNDCDMSVILTIQQGELVTLSDAANSDKLQYSYCVDPAAFTITVTDKFDDGIMSPGYVKIKYDGKQVFNSGKFFKSTERKFGNCPGQAWPSAAPSKSAVPSMVPSEPPSKMPTFPTDDVTCNAAAGEQKFVLNLLTDVFGDELSFHLQNVCNGNTIVTARKATLKSTTPYKITKCLSSGERYTFNISDASGDGMYAPAYYSVQWGNVMLVNATRDIRFETVTTFGQCTTAPSAAPSSSVRPSITPTSTPQPTQSVHPSTMPSPEPTSHPSHEPSSRPSHEPSSAPWHHPTRHPTKAPVTAPVTAPVNAPDPNANCPCKKIKNAIRRAACRKLYPKRCPS